MLEQDQAQELSQEVLMRCGKDTAEGRDLFTRTML